MASLHERVCPVCYGLKGDNMSSELCPACDDEACNGRRVETAPQQQSSRAATSSSSSSNRRRNLSPYHHPSPRTNSAFAATRNNQHHHHFPTTTTTHPRRTLPTAVTTAISPQQQQQYQQQQQQKRMKSSNRVLSVEYTRRPRSAYVARSLSRVLHNNNNSFATTRSSSTTTSSRRQNGITLPPQRQLTNHDNDEESSDDDDDDDDNNNNDDDASTECEETDNHDKKDNDDEPITIVGVQSLEDCLHERMQAAQQRGDVVDLADDDDDDDDDKKQPAAVHHKVIHDAAGHEVVCIDDDDDDDDNVEQGQDEDDDDVEVVQVIKKSRFTCVECGDQPANQQGGLCTTCIHNYTQVSQSMMDELEQEARSLSRTSSLQGRLPCLVCGRYLDAYGACTSCGDGVLPEYNDNNNNNNDNKAKDDQEARPPCLCSICGKFAKYSGMCQECAETQRNKTNHEHDISSTRAKRLEPEVAAFCCTQCRNPTDQQGVCEACSGKLAACITQEDPIVEEEEKEKEDASSDPVSPALSSAMYQLVQQTKFVGKLLAQEMTNNGNLPTVDHS